MNQIDKQIDKQTEGRMLTVGQPYSPHQDAWTEGCEYNFTAAGHELRFFLPDLTPSDIAAFQGPVEFAFTKRHGIIFLGFKFGDMPWSDSSYQWHLLPEDARAMPSLLHEGEHIPLLVVISTTGRGIIKVLRYLTFGAEFSKALHEAIHDQALAEFDRAAHDRLVGAVYKAFPAPGDLMRYCLWRTVGGA
jgi:hypothetical protein